MLHKAEIWGYVDISPGRRVENLRDDGSVRTDYYTEEQLKLLVSTAVETRGAHPLNFNPRWSLQNRPMMVTPKPATGQVFGTRISTPS
jgi:hypothetical protein